MGSTSDDQALYRFRGATVENFVNFPNRCKRFLGKKSKEIILFINYRSRKDIVEFCNQFILDKSCDWHKRGGRGFYRVMNKGVEAERKDAGVAVIASSREGPEDVATQIAMLVQALIKARKVNDANEIAFLFPSLNSRHVERMQIALEAVGQRVYAPRAGTFLNVSESKDIFGLIFQVFGAISHNHNEFSSWLEIIDKAALNLIGSDTFLKHFIEQRKSEVKEAASDYEVLSQVLRREGWKENENYDPDKMATILAKAEGLSDKSRMAIKSGVFNNSAKKRLNFNKPFKIKYAVSRATSLDWNVLDLFYQLCGFDHFKKMFDMAERQEDEGPVCNMSLISQYLSRYIDEYPYPISGEWIMNGTFLNVFTNYLYMLFRRGVSEYENDEDPFPKGRIAFITIHQAKGLEFPIVILANPRKDPRLQMIEEMVAPLLTRESEPLDRMPNFDVMRMFYVALSRAMNLLVISHFQGPGQRLNEPFNNLLDNNITRIPKFDISDVPASNYNYGQLPESYSYTGDFMLYKKCPRQYMIFRKYGFIPSQSQTMFFGSLVHQTLEDLHRELIAMRIKQ